LLSKLRPTAATASEAIMLGDSANEQQVSHIDTLLDRLTTAGLGAVNSPNDPMARSAASGRGSDAAADSIVEPPHRNSPGRQLPPALTTTP
jgi:hypothetical protein